MRLVLFLAVWGWGVVRGEVDAAGHVCGEQFVTWPQSQLEKVCQLDAQPSTCWLVGGPLAWPLPLCQVQMLIWATCGTEAEPGTQGMCACVPASSHSWAQLAVCWESGVGLGWAQTLSVRCCGGLWLLVSLCSPLPPPPSPLYPPEKTSALHAALLPTHCASWQTHNLTILGLIWAFSASFVHFFKNMYCIIDNNKFLRFIAKLSFFFWSRSKIFFV